jgi:hypothetical protein
VGGTAVEEELEEAEGGEEEEEQPMEGEEVRKGWWRGVGCGSNRVCACCLLCLQPAVRTTCPPSTRTHGCPALPVPAPASPQGLEEVAPEEGGVEEEWEEEEAPPSLPALPLGRLIQLYPTPLSEEEVVRGGPGCLVVFRHGRLALPGSQLCSC